MKAEQNQTNTTVTLGFCLVFLFAIAAVHFRSFQVQDTFTILTFWNNTALDCTSLGGSIQFWFRKGSGFMFESVPIIATDYFGFELNPKSIAIPWWWFTAIPALIIILLLMRRRYLSQP